MRKVTKEETLLNRYFETVGVIVPQKFQVIKEDTVRKTVYLKNVLDGHINVLSISTLKLQYREIENIH